MRRPDGRLVIGGRHESGRTDDDSVGNVEAAGHMKDWLRQLLANFGAPATCLWACMGACSQTVLLLVRAQVRS